MSVMQVQLQATILSNVMVSFGSMLRQSFSQGLPSLCFRRQER